MAYARATAAQRLARCGQYAAWQARKEAFRRGRSWLQMYDEGVSRGLRPVRPKGGGIWFDWCMMNLGPPQREVEGVTVARVGLNVTVSGAETTMVRRVVRSERKPGERWKRAEPAVGYEARRGVRRGLVMGRVKKTRQTARVWLDAGTVRRMST